MAKAKHQKPKPNKAKQPQTRKRGGKQNDVSELRSQLDLFGLKIIQVTSDGNCFFRALADQLEGNEDDHDKYRSMVVQFIKKNREMFEPFVEYEVPFDEYCRSMGEDGTWAGNVELQAASLVTRCNICIHRHMSPRWYIQNFDEHEARMIHLSYHDGEHYNSVRLKEDTCSGPARPIVIKGDGELSAKSNQPKLAAVKSKQDCGDNAVHQRSIELVKAGSGCEDTGKVEQALQKVAGNVDAAVELLIAEQGSVDQIVADDELYHSVKSSNDEQQDENSELHKLDVEDEASKLDSSGNDTERTYRRNNGSQLDEKKISRNKACPCGSKKKYKSCCGTIAGRSSKFSVNQTVDYGKSRRERKQGRKAGSKAVNSIQSDGGPPDMGALCI
ncbi:hypothetical protein ACJIZ3_014899 [Penstemon smallii]|uniref:OTU domain-containing protein n=1 Tax=Penstemon smallii TaxID=265156 RepID=A0ABD3RPD3_9LAMI